MKLLKRYANRRLYDPETSKTITLEDVADMIINGEEIRVIDNMSGSDITPKILGQTFLKVFLGQRNEEFSNFMLSALIRETGKDISSLFGRLVLGGIGASYLTRDRLEKILQSMISLGELKLEMATEYRDDLLTHMASRASENKLRIQEDLKKIGKELEDSTETDLPLEDLSEKIRKIAESVKEKEA
ncbi:polyhydroxyalkanoate synthesis regulator DNA-binding domain-containing protein [Leptospira borgpetersenii]|uniref:Polyhydroxyalkanoate synthesis repressor PhaR n=1 Tax=Leptospira borgpetersenii serovar Javanica str. UI 09931 TaxID=1049767 RepID=A0AAV3JGG1_LEPBO|nr:polyhydroxyalkanoate synthesis regulator DNA-binding domain-containing protein [Leptospira borgpetersenii]AXX17159.1 polyhydroxyalkanoate biosynthesis repressor PhaR [Leptospira borgpetersenii serovar Ceylonica]EKQ92512.1 putative polyhydroxyalkanoate synthesis repressor PhaR [Leptospira borgpetersenii str. UI 09149]EMN58136.1 putative polyhydroxyalkanoate synthesis repressor PhaR [Leptospira borgpetersenii serovar Javanica str. MK146]EPG58704.1 putative polyhydroxyalkanoate synthesis repres